MNWTNFFLGMLFPITIFIWLYGLHLFVVKSVKSGLLYLVITITLISGFIFGLTAKADDFLIRYSANPDTTARSLSIGETIPTYILNYKLEGGSIWDKRATNGANPFASVGLGISPSSGPLFLEFYQNILYCTNPDGQYLSSNFEFMEDLGIGFKGKHEESLVFGYRHISNGGLVPPNNGLDLLNLSVRFPL